MSTKPKPAAPAAPEVAEVLAAPAPAPVMVGRFVIESNIPLPTKRVGPKGESAYPYKVLEIGQSFFLPATEKMPEPWKTLTSMSSRTSRELHPKQFTTARETGKDGVEGVRIWRKADSEKPLAPPKKINRKPKGAAATEAARLAAEAAAGDTSQRQHPTPDFDGAAPPPPPPPPAA